MQNKNIFKQSKRFKYLQIIQGTFKMFLILFEIIIFLTKV